MKNGSTLAKISLDFGLNKSRLAYYQTLGFLKPFCYIGKAGIFNRKEVIRIIKKIDLEQNKGKKLNQIKEMLQIK